MVRISAKPPRPLIELPPVEDTCFELSPRPLEVEEWPGLTLVELFRADWVPPLAVVPSIELSALPLLPEEAYDPETAPPIPQ